VTSKTVPFYSGPEEGLSWLFASEYAGINLEEPDSQGWTLLGDAAFHFGRRTQLCIDNPAVSWQCLYLLQAGTNPHAKSSKAQLTPLDTYFRGCTVHQVEHAGKWLKLLSRSGLDLYKYATEEQNLHYPEHLVETSWDEELRRWIPTKQRVVYHFGDTSDQLSIWLEDYDALNWFRNGRFDLDIFLVCTPSESQTRWQIINAMNRIVGLNKEGDFKSLPTTESAKLLSILHSVLCARWFQLLILSLVFHYLFHIFLVSG
jgi:hypothetical protein